MVTGWAPVHTFWRTASVKLEEVFGRREGFQIGPHPFCPHLNHSSRGAWGSCLHRTRIGVVPRFEPSAAFVTTIASLRSPPPARRVPLPWRAGEGPPRNVQTEPAMSWLDQ